MFYLSLIEHTLQLPPDRFNIPLAKAIKGELESLFLDKVIKNLGLCVSVYDIKNIDGGFIFPGDGASTYTVECRLIMFRPFSGEVIQAKVKESDANGLRLSLGFFDDIYVYNHLLLRPCHSEPDPTKRYQKIWFWDYQQAEAEDEADSDEQKPSFVIDGNDEVRFQVVSVSYPTIPVERPQDEKPFAPMVITGTLDCEGLGPVSWW